MRGWCHGGVQWQWRRRNWRFLAEHQGGDRTLGERMDLLMFGYFRFQMKRQHFFRRPWQSDQWDLRALGVPLLFLDLRLLTFDWRSNFGKWCLASLLLRQPIWWEQISLSWIFLLPLISAAKWYLRWQEFCHWSEFNASCLDQLRISWWSALDQ